MLRRHTGNDADIFDLFDKLLVTEGSKLGSGDGATGNAQLFGDRRSRQAVLRVYLELFCYLLDCQMVPGLVWEAVGHLTLRKVNRL